MTRKQRRLAFVAAGMAVLGIAVALVLAALEENIVFFFSPTDIVTKQVPQDRRLRLGGLVVKGSVARKPDGLTTEFRVTDMANSVTVTYRGVLPDLFREGQGVIVQGQFGADGQFRADEVLAKHDENYMPPEVADALKRSGVWQGKEMK
jgi:cytochrome c-type biogenesis protein CcmE